MQQILSVVGLQSTGETLSLWCAFMLPRDDAVEESYRVLAWALHLSKVNMGEMTFANRYCFD